MRRRRCPKVSGVMGLLTGPHQTLSAVFPSRTTNLSFAERPVCSPVVQTSGPPAPIRPSPRSNAASYSASTPRFQCTVSGLVSPCFSSSLIFDTYRHPLPFRYRTTGPHCASTASRSADPSSIPILYEGYGDDRIVTRKPARRFVTSSGRKPRRDGGHHTYHTSPVRRAEPEPESAQRRVGNECVSECK